MLAMNASDEITVIFLYINPMTRPCCGTRSAPDVIPLLNLNQDNVLIVQSCLMYSEAQYPLH
jgi:hypothetical protein